jgi:hypothetical protein
MRHHDPLVRAALMALLTAWFASPAWSQQIQIISAPPYGQNGYITGVVTGITDFQDYDVAPWIQIPGVGWWPKPTFDHPTVPIDSNGFFTAYVTTGGVDQLATNYYAALVPVGTTPGPSSNGFPPFGYNPIASATYDRYPQSFTFAGRSWAAKGPYYGGPGGNTFSPLSSDVWVDSAGLHLTIHNHDGQWWATEVTLPQRLGYGTYAFKTSYAVNSLDPDVTFGAFTWDPYGQGTRIPSAPNREIDFEDTRWGNASDPTNSQTLVQPSTTNAPNRITIPDGNVTLTRFFKWLPGSVEFVTLLGDHSPTNYSPGDVIQDWTFTQDLGAGKIVPDPGSAFFEFNLWLNHNPNAGPSNGLPTEVLITDFAFTPGPMSWNVVSGNWVDPNSWVSGVPGGGLQAVVNNGGQVAISAGVATCADLVLGSNAGDSGTVCMTGGRLEANWVTVGQGGDGNFRQSGGTQVIRHGLTVARDANSTGTFTLQDGNLVVPRISIGTGGRLTLSGGSLRGDPLDANLLASVLSSGLVEIAAGTYWLASIDCPDANVLAGTVEIDAGATLRVGDISQAAVFVSGTLILDGSLLSRAAPPDVVAAATDAGAPVPEPASLALLALGGGGLLLRGRRGCARGGPA